MIVVLKNGAPSQKVDELKASLKARGLDLHESKGADVTILGLNAARVADQPQFSVHQIVHKVLHKHLNHTEMCFL